MMADDLLAIPEALDRRNWRDGKPPTSNATSVPVADIFIGERHRRDMGDIDALADSIAEMGLLQPIGITRDKRLVFGERRLRACKDILGLADIDCRIVDVPSIVEGEYAENEIRKAFTPEERVYIGRAIELEIGNRHGGDRKTDQFQVEKVPLDPGQKTREVAARKSGFGNDRTYRQAKEIVEAAEAEPEKFADVLDQMNRTGKVGGAHRRLRMSRDEQRVMSVRPVAGKFRALVIDPPWDYEWLSLAGRAAPGYATMTHDELLALDVAQWAEDNCHLYLWTTNNFIARAGELMTRWGFQHKTVLTWVKPRWGLGSYFRNSTEHVLFGVRGELRTRSDSIATHFEAPVTEHSAKPDAFYNIVRQASYPPYGEAFQRAERDDFQNLFETSESAVG
jgi:N6-adenosine-specific RNA methylase IME4